ncbi:hypothetical protein BT96DRAFT_995192 [Gymnopus androsaceus JB14]|uniref:Uncharacterized protein n=1 Tax=Gymnopus androsaceus JB14 TaxID=1447944 RepID=A0A6A4HM71_9AGAR|nr:hypothetical protein BT96DRAFT_995192 [Gymnopus androsaceus JB14]
MCLGIITTKIYVCVLDLSWTDLAVPVCPLEKVAIGKLITNLLVGITLVVIPTCLLGHLKLLKDKRRMLIVIFRASLLTSAVSVVHVVSLMVPSYFYLVPLISEVKIATALTVSNLGVAAPFLY